MDASFRGGCYGVRKGDRVGKLGSARERQGFRLLCPGLELPEERLARAKVVHRALVEDVPAIHQHHTVEQPQQL